MSDNEDNSNQNNDNFLIRDNDAVKFSKDESLENQENPLNPTFLRESDTFEEKESSCQLQKRYTTIESAFNMDTGLGNLGKSDFILSENLEDIAVREDYKVLFLGNFGVGKSSIIMRFINNTFNNDINASLGQGTYKKSIKIDQETLINLSLDDTLGIERASTVPKQFYKDVHGVIIVFDITDNNSYNDLDKWISNSNDFAPKDAVYYIVGNKIDMSFTRSVDKNNAEAKAEKIKANYLEVSAKTGANVDLLFEDLATKIFARQKENVGENKVERQKERHTIGLSKKKFKGFKRKCCSGVHIHKKHHNHEHDNQEQP